MGGGGSWDSRGFLGSRLWGYRWEGVSGRVFKTRIVFSVVESGIQSEEYVSKLREMQVDGSGGSQLTGVAWEGIVHDRGPGMTPYFFSKIG